MYKEIAEQAKCAVKELIDAAGLTSGDILVIGCSSSEIMGSKIGSDSSLPAAQAVFGAIYPELKARGIKTISVMGYRNSDTFLQSELSIANKSYVATEDGSLGAKGTVIDAMYHYRVKGDVILSCGPKPMLRAIKAYANKNDMLCYVSMEERMACGIGACLGCVCQSTKIDEHSRVHNKRVCKDGPVFLANEVEL